MCNKNHFGKKLFCNVLGIDFVVPKNGHWREKLLALGPVHMKKSHLSSYIFLGIWSPLSLHNLYCLFLMMNKITRSLKDIANKIKM